MTSQVNTTDLPSFETRRARSRRGVPHITNMKHGVGAERIMPATSKVNEQVQNIEGAHTSVHRAHSELHSVYTQVHVKAHIHAKHECAHAHT